MEQKAIYEDQMQLNQHVQNHLIKDEDVWNNEQQLQ
jgi:hypothetical protein